MPRGGGLRDRAGKTAATEVPHRGGSHGCPFILSARAHLPASTPPHLPHPRCSLPTERADAPCSCRTSEPPLGPTALPLGRGRSWYRGAPACGAPAMAAGASTRGPALRGAASSGQRPASCCFRSTSEGAARGRGTWESKRSQDSPGARSAPVPGLTGAAPARDLPPACRAAAWPSSPRPSIQVCPSPPLTQQHLAHGGVRGARREGGGEGVDMLRLALHKVRAVGAREDAVAQSLGQGRECWRWGKHGDSGRRKQGSARALWRGEPGATALGADGCVPTRARM
jgi:hypothetical protein